MNQQSLQKYAEFAVRSGANIQPGQTLIIGAPIEAAPFARLCVAAAYKAGAREVVLHYVDEQYNRQRMEYTAAEVLETPKPWLLGRYMDYANPESGLATLRISGSNPEIYKGLPTEKISRANAAASRLMRPYSDLAMASRVQWSIAAVPTEAWACKVFPGLAPAEAVEKLWATIFEVCRIGAEDPVAAWQKHSALLQQRGAWLNGQRFAALHLQSENGTNLEVGLANTHLWGGGAEKSTGGVWFLPNIPTEEVFTAPHRLGTNGVVKSSMPYVYNGGLISGITVRFKNGEAVEYSAETGGDLLREMLNTDEGARHLGEIALVPATSPIRQSGVLFYNTLFDENAACHMAFGEGYPGTVQGGETMEKEALAALGVNSSLIHEDIMIGTADMQIDGIDQSGRRVPIFRGGEWVE